MMVLALVGLLVSACVGRPAENASGEDIYLQLCSNCHGDGLEGGIGPPLGPGSFAFTQPDEFLQVTIIEGRGRMPSFASSLKDPQLDRLISYIREVQQG